MNGKPKISPTNTYIFDEEDLQELDDSSLTSVMRELQPEVDGPDEAAERAPDNERTKQNGDTTINKILAELAPDDAAVTGGDSARSDKSGTDRFLSKEVLLSPDEMFSKELDDTDS